MAQLCKIERDVEIKSSTSKIFTALTTKAHNVPQAANMIHGVTTQDSIRTWEYTIDGKTEVFKEKMEVDKANNSITLKTVGGNILEVYKSFMATYHFKPKEKLVKITFNYEKLTPETPTPTNYMNLVVNLVKDIDANFITT